MGRPPDKGSGRAPKESDPATMYAADDEQHDQSKTAAFHDNPYALRRSFRHALDAAERHIRQAPTARLRCSAARRICHAVMALADELAAEIRNGGDHD